MPNHFLMELSALAPILAVSPDLEKQGFFSRSFSKSGI